MKYEVFHLCERSEQYEWNECKLETLLDEIYNQIEKGNWNIKIQS